MKKIKKFWSIFFIALLILTVFFSIILSVVAVKILGINFLWGVLATFIGFLIITGLAIKQGWTQVPEKIEYIIEIFGDYIDEPIKEGLVLLFPWFGFFKIRKKVPMSEQMMELYLDEKIKEGYGGGDIEFADCSSSVVAFFYFQVIDSARAAYFAGDIDRFIEEKADGALRSFFGPYKIDDAIKMRNNFTLKAIVCCLDFNAVPKPQINDNDYYSSEFYINLTYWGIGPKSFTISDIELPEEIKIQRARKLAAEKDLEIAIIKKEQAEIDKKIKVIQAEANKEMRILEGTGEKQYQILEGEGQSEKICNLLEKGMPQEGIVNFLVSEMKWTAVTNSKNTDKTIILDGNQSNNVAAGVEFGTGFRVSQDKEKKGDLENDSKTKDEVKPEEKDVKKDEKVKEKKNKKSKGE